MKIMKFGGTSVQDAVAIRRLVEIVKTRTGSRVVVVSALSKVTDALLEIARAAEGRDLVRATGAVDELLARHLRVHADLGLDLSSEAKLKEHFQVLKSTTQALVALGEVSLRSKDMIASFGEIASSILVFEIMKASALRTAWWDARELVVTDSEFGSARVDFGETDRRIVGLAKSTFDVVDVVVTQGFIAREAKGATTTLGRGGSDFSGAIFGAALNAEAIEIWTDVDGILTTDPRVVPEARRLKRISFGEAAELATFGAKVLHPATIAPAVRRNIPVWVLNSKNPGNPGTEVTANQSSYDGVLKAIAFKRNVTVLNVNSAGMVGVSGFLKKVFDVLAEEKISIDLISTSEVNISMTLDVNPNEETLSRACDRLKLLGDVDVRRNEALISVVGSGMKSTAGVAGQIFGALKGINILMISMGASELNLSFIVEGGDCDRAVKLLHDTFFKSNLPDEVFA